MGKRASRRTLLVVFLIWTTAGCGGQRLAEVRGTVTLDGNPVSNAIVTFHPQFEGAIQPTGKTDANGRFELHTYSQGKGAARGEYKVTVFKGVDADLGEKRPKDPPRPGPGNSRPRSILPQQYEEAATTPLHAIVPTSGEIVLELKSQ